MYPIPHCYNYQVYTDACREQLVNNSITLALILIALYLGVALWWRLSQEKKDEH